MKDREITSHTPKYTKSTSYPTAFPKNDSVKVLVEVDEDDILAECQLQPTQSEPCIEWQSITLHKVNNTLTSPPNFKGLVMQGNL